MYRANPLTFLADIGAGVRAAGRLAVGQDSPLEADSGAVRHSFAAAALCLPASAFIRWVEWRDAGMPAPLWHAVGIDLTLYAIGWAGFLLLCRALLPLLGLQRAWPRLVVVWNWCNVAQYAVLLAGSLFDLFRTMSFVASVVGLVTLFWAAWIEFRALRPVLGGKTATAGGLAAGLVALDFVIGLLTQAATVSLGG